MKILGIDPSLSSSGWGVLSVVGQKISYVASGNIITLSSDKIEKRLAKIYSEITNVIEYYSPELIGMEETFVNKNFASSLKLSLARGAIIASIGKSNAKFLEFSPNLVKKTVVGVGHADKLQVFRMIKLLLGVDFKTKISTPFLDDFQDSHCKNISKNQLRKTPESKTGLRRSLAFAGNDIFLTNGEQLSQFNDTMVREQIRDPKFDTANLEVNNINTADTSKVARKTSGEDAERTMVREQIRDPKFDTANLEVSKVYDQTDALAIAYTTFINHQNFISASLLQKN
jgi:crossover junction endodeoxyribonuclease RuvC